MDTLLRAKHWQIFLFAFGIPWLLMLIVMSFGMADLFSLIKANPDPQDMAIVMSEFMRSMTLGILPITVLSALVSYGWMLSVAQRISPMAPLEYRPKQPWLTAAIVCTLLFTIFNISTSIYMYSTMLEGFADLGSSPSTFDNDPFGFENVGPAFWILNVISMITSFGSFGLLIFVSYQLSRSVKGAELQRYMPSGDLIGPFFAFYFLFIGIWFLQPIINKLHEEGPGGRNDLDHSLILD